TDVHRHLEPVAIVEIGAAHFGVVPRVTEIEPAPRRIGLESTGGEHHCFGIERGNAVGSARHHAVYAAGFALREPHGTRVIANFDAHRLRGFKPRLGQAYALV